MEEMTCALRGQHGMDCAGPVVMGWCDSHATVLRLLLDRRTAEREMWVPERRPPAPPRKKVTAAQRIAREKAAAKRREQRGS